MQKWERRNLRLRENHGWKAKRGYQIFVLDRGAVRLDLPGEWIATVKTEENSGRTTFTFTDRPAPDDDCRLQVTAIYLPPGIDSSALPLPEMLEETAGGPDEYTVLGRSAAVHEQRRDLELAWVETRFIDPGEHREARSRTYLARRDGVHALITFEYWPEDAGRFLPIFDEITRSLRLAEFIRDPTRGPGG